MITTERLAEIEAAPREASIFKAEAKELADAYRERVPGLRVTKGADGAWLHIEAPRWWTCKTHGDALPHNAWGCPNCVTELRDENARLRTALDKIAERTSSDDPCRPLVQIARDALRHNVI